MDNLIAATVLIGDRNYRIKIEPKDEEVVRRIVKTINDKGSVCGLLEKDVAAEREQFTWSGLNDLPYGTYTLELSHGDDEVKMNLVKRV